MSPRDTAAVPAPAPAAARPAPPKPPIAILVAMTGLGPFTMQVLIPSLPGLVQTLSTTTAAVQLTLTLYLLGTAVGQLVYGPLSDRYGRRPLLLAGLALHLVATLAAAAAPSIGWLIAARVGQALGACAGLVLGRAIVRDAWPREQAASVLGYVIMAMSVAPMIAPLLGAWLDAAFGWRATMLACAGFALPLLIATRTRLPETLPEPQPLPGLAGLLGAYGQLLALPAFRALAAVTAFSTAVFFAFMAGAPFVVVQGMGHTPTDYALAFMMMSVAYALGNWIAGRLSERLGTWRMLSIGNGLAALGALAMLAAQALPPEPHILGVFLPVAVIAVGNGVAMPNAIAAAVSVRPQLAGTASGLVGSLQMALGAAVTVPVGLAEDGGGLATACAMLGCAVATLVAQRAARRAAPLG